MNDIIKFLDFEDDDLETDPPYVKNGKRFITIRKKLKAHYCPICSYRMYSKGIYERTVNHPIVQDGLPLVLKVQQRRWRCNNPACGHTMNDEFIFLEARKQNTKMTHDRKVHEEREQDFHRRLSFSHSREYKILKHFSWVIITNQEDLNYSKKPFWNYRLNQWTDIHDLEEAIFRIAPELRQMRKLKEKYIDFNRRYGNDQKRARPALKELITLYRKSGFKEFETIASTLEKHFESIICSFIMIQRFCKGNEYLARLSNGPMEALNRIVKDQKRYAHGFRNFDHLRNRFLFSQRRNAQILATPKDRSEVIPHGTPRGPYRKK